MFADFFSNLTIDDKQCTIAWYVDDAKVFNKNPDDVTKIIYKSKTDYGDLKIARGKIILSLKLKLK